MYKYIVFGISLLITTTAYAATPAPAEAKQGMVATSQHLATQVGVEILKQGGNAIDAAVAVGYALAVTDPCCGNLGGGGFMLIKKANSETTFINFREKAPEKITQNTYKKADGSYDSHAIQYGYLAVGVPGTVMGLNTALEKHGTMPLNKIMQPAIDLAQKGFILNTSDAALLAQHQADFAAQANVEKIFLKNGQPYVAGDRLTQSDLAKTLTAIQKEGSKVFYEGWIADAIVKASTANGGILTQQDFKNYHITETTPVMCSYQGYQIASAPPPSSGGITLCEMLSILEAFPIKFLGFHSAASVHYLVEAMRYAYADRNEYLGDPDFVKNPLDKLLSPTYITDIQSKISPFKAGNSASIGFFATKEKMQTTHYSIIDKAGNAVAVTYTINGNFGAQVIAGNTGFFLNNEMDDFTLTPGIPNMFGLVQGENNALAPGKRPLSSMSPTIVSKDKQVYMVLGAAGGSTIITQVLQTIINVIDYGMNIQEAIDAPRIHMQWLPDVIFQEPFSLSPDTQEKLVEMGYTLQNGSPYNTPHWGVSNAVLRDLDTGMLYGASDSRRPTGSAAGY